MSVPHLDARQLDGKPVVLFGLCIGHHQFLKNGSWWDLFSSVTHDNLMGMLRVGIHNLDLVQYLMQQAELTDADRQAVLAQYFPEAKREDWKLVTAGQRVQIIKRDPEKGAVLQFGTEIVGSEDGSIAALLGASPGASTAPHIMLNLLKKSFPEQMASAEWKSHIQQIVPYGRKINEDAAYTNEIRRMTSSALKLPYVMFLPIWARRPKRLRACRRAPEPHAAEQGNAGAVRSAPPRTGPLARPAPCRAAAPAARAGCRAAFSCGARRLRLRSLLFPCTSH
jgi:malate dehydrogenase (quinone)